MEILIVNIKELVLVDTAGRTLVSGADMAEMETLPHAFLYIKDGLIADFGEMHSEKGKQLIEGFTGELIDATDRLVYPTFAIRIHIWYIRLHAKLNISTRSKAFHMSRLPKGEVVY